MTKRATLLLMAGLLATTAVGARAQTAAANTGQAVTAPPRPFGPALDDLNGTSSDTDHLPVDQSTPETAVRSFVSELNRRDFAAAARCVYGGTLGERFAKVQTQLTPPKPTFDLLIRDLETLPNSGFPDQRPGDMGSFGHIFDPDAAIVTLALVDMGQAGHVAGNAYPLTVERLQLVHADERWYIQAPAAADDDPLVPAEDTLAYYASLMADRETLGMLKDRDELALCQNNLQQLYIGVQQYLVDYDNTFKFTVASAEDQLTPYLHSSRIFHCPLDTGNSSYSFNGNLEGVAVGTIQNPAQVVMFYEGHKGKLDFRHNGKASICYVDGHVGAVSEADAGNLQWRP